MVVDWRPTDCKTCHEFEETLHPQIPSIQAKFKSFVQDLLDNLAIHLENRMEESS